nr:hypothetical protein [uncultured bacterium]
MALPRQTARSAAGGAEKRAFPRRPIRLRAQITSQGRGICDGEIRDFCPVGLLLVFDHPPAPALEVGEQVSVRSTAGNAGVALTGRVVRGDRLSAGLSLTQPDPAALRALAAYADQADAARRDTASGTTIDGRAQIWIAACRDAAARRQDILLELSLSAMTSELERHADRAGNHSVETLFLDALATLRRSRERLRSTFAEAVQSHIVARLDPPSEPAPIERTTSANLSLVDEEELEDWLLVTDLSSQIESQLQRVLIELERRLAEVLGRPLRRQDNPFGPQVFVQAFQDSLRILNLPKLAQQACFNAFRSVLTQPLEGLYEELNGYLREQGVVPEIKHEVIRSGDGGVRRRQNAAGVMRGAVSSEPNQAAPCPAPSGPVPSATSNVAAPTAPSPVTPPSSREAIPAKVEQTLYDLVSELRMLRGSIAAAGSPQAMATPPGTGPIEPAPVHPAEARTILQALDEVQSESDASSVADGERRDYVGRILSRLAATGGGALAPREAAVLDVAGNLFEAMMKDETVAKSVRQWLSRLEIPLIKLAIQDDSLFVDRHHVAREIVNRIGQLQVYDTDESAGESALGREVGAIVERIATEPEPSAGILASALKRLNALVRIQDEAYQDNLRDLIAECEASREPEPPPPAADETPDDVQRHWLRRATRIKPGAWIRFALEGASPRRLQLAWVSAKGTRFVFADLRGLKALELTLGRFSDLLRTGAAVVLDGADEPAVDRAQYAMLQELHQKLLHETTHDQLTGLINRREFERRLESALLAAHQLDRRHTLCYVDITQFGMINARSGYEAGDRLLSEVSALLQKAMGEEALVARVGSDEFAVLLENCPANYGRKSCENFIRALDQYRFCWQNERQAVSVAIGLVQTEAFENASSLLQAAESSCQAAASRGMNHIELYHPDSAHLSDKHRAVQWLGRIDQALEEGRLELRCQRIVPVTPVEGRLPHGEILLALTDDAGMTISPQEFIITAEHYHRMPAIDRWVVQTVFRLLQEHRDRLETTGGFAINLSGRSLSDDAFKAFILAEIAQTDIPMDKICFEITETAGIANLSDASDFILDVKKTGCRFSLDDFGSGLSSYAYLKNLPVDFLKIDGGFVTHLDTSSTDFAVVKSITEIGHFMGKEVIAECVESASVLELLREIGVDYAQGYAVETPRRLLDVLGG